MDCIKEKYFVEKFINKEYQERINFELQSNKNRIKAIDRFNHNTKIIINKKNIYKVCKYIEDKELNKLLTNNIYVLSKEYNNGIVMSKADAIKYLIDSYSAVILITDNYCIIKEEYDEGNYFIIK